MKNTALIFLFMMITTTIGFIGGYNYDSLNTEKQNKPNKYISPLDSTNLIGGSYDTVGFNCKHIYHVIKGDYLKIQGDTITADQGNILIVVKKK